MPPWKDKSTARLLLVEDDAALSILLCEELAGAGFRCEVVPNGRAALERLSSRETDLALLDYSLPDMAAGELVSRARSSDSMPPFMVLTGHGDERIAVELMKLGACDYLIKDALLLHRLPEAVSRALCEIAMRQQLKVAETRLRESEARYRFLTENICDVVWLYDASLKRFTYVSPSVGRVLGYSPEELPQIELSGVMPLESGRSYRVEIRQMIAAMDGGAPSGATIAREVEHRRKDGSLFWAEVVIRFLRTDDDHIVLLGLTRDISERKRAERRLARNEAELSALYDSAPVIMMLLDGRARVRRMNRAALQFVGLHEVNSQMPAPIGQVLDCIQYALQGVCGTGQACERCVLMRVIERTARTKNPERRVEVGLSVSRGVQNRELNLLVSSSSLAVDDEPLTLLCLEDVTEHKRLEERFRQAQKLEAIGQLAGGIAHDFNNILAAMLLRIGNMKLSPAAKQSLLEEIEGLEADAHRGASLTRQLLLFGRRQIIQVGPVDLDKIIAELLKMLRRLLGEHIRCGYSSDSLPHWIEADVSMIEQVIMNLCVNARDAMPSGGSLTIGTELVRVLEGAPEKKAGRYVRLRVSDSGCGMDSLTMKRIFEPFFTTKGAERGTGLGLATVRGIVEQHRGYIDVRSRVGLGTTFDVWLPAVEPGGSTGRRGGDAPGLEGGREVLLVVEDDIAIRTLLRISLGSLGYTVLAAGSGEEALAQWHRQSRMIDLVISDHMLPGGLSGLELFQRFSAERPGVGFILSSGCAEEQLGALGGAGFAYLAKPYDIAALASLIRQCLKRKFP